MGKGGKIDRNGKVKSEARDRREQQRIKASVEELWKGEVTEGERWEGWRDTG